MKGQKNSKDMQGSSTSDRAYFDQNEKLKERGISNSGGQRSDQTSSRNSMHKPEKKKS